MTKKKTPSAQQRLIMDFVREQGTPDLDEILDHVDAASKASLQFTIRSLIAKGFVRKLGTSLRRGRMRQTFSLTPEGHLFYDPRTALSTDSVDNTVPEIPHREKSVSDFVSDFVSDLSIPVIPPIPSVSHREKSVSDFADPVVFLED